MIKHVLTPYPVGQRYGTALKEKGLLPGVLIPGIAELLS